MAELTCKFHPDKPARWRCAKCGIAFCPACIPRGQMLREEHFCPVCNSPLALLEHKQEIPPLWKRLPHILLYPFHDMPPLFLALFILFSLAPTQMDVLPGFFGAILAGIGKLVELFIIYYIVHRGYLALRHSAHGYLDAASLGNYHGGQDVYSFLGMIVAPYVLPVVVIYLLWDFGWQAMVPALVLLSYFMPASIMVAALSKSLLRAVNPVILVLFVKRVGWSYVVLFLFVNLLLLGEYAMITFVISQLPLWLFFIMQNLLLLYFTLVIFHMMGYMVYRHHDALGFNVHVDFIEDEASLKKDEEPKEKRVVRQADTLASGGRQLDAIAMLEKEARNSEDLTLHARLHKLLMQSQDVERILANAPAYIALLVEGDKPSQALGVFGGVLKIAPDYCPDPVLASQLLDIARQAEDHKMVVEIASRFASHYPDAPNMVDVAFTAAKSLGEVLDQPERAARVLNSLLERYPSHERIPEIRRYLGHLTSKIRLQKSSGT